MSTQILVVEDDSFFIKLIGLILKKRSDYEVSFARSVVEAKSKMKHQKFDAVLLDYYLKDGTALDILKFLYMPTIILSGSQNLCLAELKNCSKWVKEVLIKDSSNAYITKLPLFIDKVVIKQKSNETLSMWS